MSSTAEHLASLDATLAAAKEAWEAEKRELKEHILHLETELAIRTRLHDTAIEAKERALQTAATFVAKLGMCTTVLEEAREMAIAAGLYHQQKPATEGDTATANKALIDSVTGGAS